MVLGDVVSRLAARYLLGRELCSDASCWGKSSLECLVMLRRLDLHLIRLPITFLGLRVGRVRTH